MNSTLVRFFSTKNQREFAKSNWTELRNKSLESFKGAALISFVFGTLAVLTDGILSQIFNKGIVEHIAQITLPLAVSSGYLTSGLAALARKKFKVAFVILRSISCSCLILAFNLFIIVSGLCLGLAIPGMSNGFDWLFVWTSFGTFIYFMALSCQNVIALNYNLRSFSFSQLYAIAPIILGFLGLLWALNEAAHDIVFASNQFSLPRP